MEDRFRVLLIEDDSKQAKKVREKFKKFDARFDIDALRSSDAWLDRLSESDYQVIIIGNRQLKAQGNALQHRLEERGVDTPVVVISDSPDEQTALEALRAGAYEYIIRDDTYLSMLPKTVQKTIEKCQLESKLRESEGKYHNIFEKANDAILIINPLTSIILEANIKTTQITGFTKDELFSKQFSELYPGAQGPQVERLLQRALHEGSCQDDSLSLQTRDRRLVPVDINASVIYLGRYQYILSIVRDNAEKKHLQSLILNSKRRLQAVFDGITDIIYQVNRNFEIVMANMKVAELCNTQPEQLIGTKCYEARFNCEQPCIDCPVERTFETGASSFVEKTHRDEIFEMHSYPIFAGDGSIESVVVYSKNVTEKKKLEKTLIQSEKLASIGLLSSGIAHEIRNPLNIIETARYYIEEFMPERSPDIRAKLDIIKKNVKRASNIINNLLEYSRPSEREREPIHLRKLIENTIALIGKELQAKNIAFTLRCEGDYRVYFNVESLKQVLLNMIINAVQAMPDGGKLTVAIEPMGERWIDIKVTDTGVGISEAHLPHIFSPFFTTKEVGVGTGLGLYVSHLIMEREGGKIKVKSKVGKGTTFTLSLPRSEGEMTRE